MFVVPYSDESVMCWQCFMQGILAEEDPWIDGSIPHHHVNVAVPRSRCPGLKCYSFMYHN